jgi:CARDB
MNGIRITVRHALRRARRRPAALSRTGRLSLVLAMVATVIASALGPPASVGVASEPVARLQVVVKEILIHNDREGIFSGAGEMDLRVSVRICPDSIPAPCLASRGEIGTTVRGSTRFSASTGDIVVLNRVVPQAGDEMTSADTTPELGFYAIAGYYHLVRFDMVELDSVTNHEGMGWVFHVLESAKYGQDIGTHTARSVLDQGARAGDFTITYEIRRVPLPDIRPVNITVNDLPNSTKKRVCTVVQNIEAGEAGPFLVSFYADGSDLPGGKPSLPRLASGDSSELCIDTQLPPGQLQLRVVVDEPRRVIEFNEANNVIEQPYAATPQQASTAAESGSTPGAAQADLTISTIKVNGQAPDGKDDCKDGKNDVAVVVKNAGTASTGAFAVRLTVDGYEAGEESVDSLEAGKEREVRFDDVRLKQGEHKLAAALDSENTVAESIEGNNGRQATARCQDD